MLNYKGNLNNKKVEFVNGSYNILRKAILTAFVNGIQGIGGRPKVITLN
jgi:hypothetical protein